MGLSGKPTVPATDPITLPPIAPSLTCLLAPCVTLAMQRIEVFLTPGLIQSRGSHLLLLRSR